MQKSLFFLCCLFLLTALHFSSCAPSNAGSKSTTSQDSADQQVSEYVVDAFEDSKGNLWFGTMSDGAARFDGKKLTFLTQADGLIENTTVCIREDRAGNLWFGSHNGAVRYDGKKYTRFGPEQGLPGAGCGFMVTRDGTLWAKTNAGVFQLKGDHFVQFQLPEPEIENPSWKWEKGKVWDFLEDSHGNLWFARDGLGVCKYDPTQKGNPVAFTHYTRKDGLCSNNVSSILEDQQGNMWFGCLSSDFPAYQNEGGLARYDGKTFTRFPDQKGLHESDIYHLFIEKSGKVWIGALATGAWVYDPAKGGAFTLFSESDRPDLIEIFGMQSMLEDRRGTLWCGFSGGLFRFEGDRFVNVRRGGPW
ncbi:MAG: hypothetical protein H6581_15240 [Bacteroidia bacterium]|nr:hypothetical protein [Bacteroidia bacterium]